MSVLLNTQKTTVTIQGREKLGYALPLNTDYQSLENLKKFVIAECPLHANQDCRRWAASCSNFPDRPTDPKVAVNKPVLPEIEHLKRKIPDRELDSLRAVLNRNADVFSKHKADIGC